MDKNWQQFFVLFHDSLAVRHSDSNLDTVAWAPQVFRRIARFLSETGFDLFEIRNGFYDVHQSQSYATGVWCYSKNIQRMG